MFSIFYGVGHEFLDVTKPALEACFDGNRIYIPSGDTGAMFFPDPLYGQPKTIVVIRNDADRRTCEQYLPGQEIRFLLTEEDKHQAAVELEAELAEGARSVAHPGPGLSTDETIAFYHSQLRCVGGDITHEWREQSMAVNFIDPEAKVLELGSNIGRNTLMISCILNDDRNLVTLECNPFFVDLLRNNRFANRMRFHIQPSALSHRKLIQRSDCQRFGNEAEAWESVPSDVLPEGYEWIDTITFDELKEKYQLDFDTLVADCEGALYFILQDDPGMLAKINTVILESDYRLAEHKWAVEKIFRASGLDKVHAEALVPNLTDLPDDCASSFWEVWIRVS